MKSLLFAIATVVACFAQPQDELGMKGTTFVATCDNGLCTAHAQ